MKTIFLVTILFVTLTKIEAGIRCSIGDKACSAGCVILGQSSGICDDDGECW